jgi:F-type H+-transporting ATPase subunit b
LRAIAIIGACASASPALAQDHAQQNRAHTPRNEPVHGAGASHETGHGEAAAQGEHHGAEHHQEFNWYYGMLGEKADAEPSVLWRRPGMPAPFAAQLLNTALLVLVLVRFGKAPIARGLADRRKRIMKGMDDAAAMKKEAEQQLEFYKDRIANLDAEIERVKREMREGAEAERARILTEAAARRARLEQEARVLVEQELKAVREELTRETTQAALRSARELLKSATSTEDHRRLCEQYLDNFRQQRPAEAGVRSGST